MQLALFCCLYFPLADNECELFRHYSDVCDFFYKAVEGVGFMPHKVIDSGNEFGEFLDSLHKLCGIPESADGSLQEFPALCVDIERKFDYLALTVYEVVVPFLHPGIVCNADFLRTVGDVCCPDVVVPELAFVER